MTVWLVISKPVANAAHKIREAIRKRVEVFDLFMVNSPWAKR
jgi:hypothetical protein